MTRFRAVWPIDDQDLTLADLITEAIGALPDVLWEAGAEQTGPMSWMVLHTDPPQLVGECDARPWTDPAMNQAGTAVDEWCHLVRLRSDPHEAAVRCGMASLRQVEKAAVAGHHPEALRLLAEVTLHSPMQDADGRDTADVSRSRARRLRSLAERLEAA